MNDKKDFWIILWSMEDITIDNIDLKRSIESEIQDAEVTIVTLKDIKQMDLGRLRRLLDTHSGKSALIVSPSKELGNEDYWKLGFVMGRMSFQLQDKKIAPIVAFLKGEKNSFFHEISKLCTTTVEDPIDMKGEIKALMQELGISTKFVLTEFTSAKKVTEKAREI
jgi:hypothetical protein